MKIVKLDKKQHDKKNFDCGVESLNNYLKSISGQHDKKDLSRTFVLVSEQRPSQIKGFYSLTLCTVELESLPPDIAKKYPNTIHCALIGRLAVNKSSQRQGIGSILLIDAIKKAIKSSTNIPTPMIIIDAKTPIARQIYLDMGFSSFPVDSDRLFMTMRDATEMINSIYSEE